VSIICSLSDTVLFKQIANKAIEMKNKEINEAVEKLKMTELKKQEWEQNSRKLEEDVPRLRQALEQSITRLNRMSSDSDFYVDRRIVIKLLVTYFQRQHSREVLDLMVRMLGFTEEDKQRVGLAQQTASKGGVVRGVFSLPGRFVGGLLGSGGDASPRAAPSDNQSFADLWIDFLLKESEEREKREKREKAEADAKTGTAVEAMSRSSSSRLLSETEPGIAPLAAYNGLPPKVSLSRPQSPGPQVPYHRPSSSFSGSPSSLLSHDLVVKDMIRTEVHGVHDVPGLPGGGTATGDSEFSSVPLNSLPL
jgi:hypothetical protein